ncbi:iron dicitrate transport regulator FecR [Xylophilus ampelinus]|uniref:FecR family protein n=1 Tax=Xylophilus ampelinus TaxID=54067 RepID=A0A318SI18_9BURK|nr:iron dicitrate transport regulator FecR [Xylophilus ampelinus]MCS4511359.1 FecR family protein [Xylophilus ampelinus]PYE74885.1 hypothetical protein DFQ15_12328 [Xylophilus ampelinus]
MRPAFPQARPDADVFWFRRRDFLRGAAAWAAAGGTAARAQGRGNIVALQGDVLRNGQRLAPDATIVTGDTLRTGPGSSLVFVIGGDAFRMRPESHLVVERGATLHTVGLLRLATGAVTSVWSRGPQRAILTPTLTAGIRGTGVYTQVYGGENPRTYFCNCYGTVDLVAGTDKVTSRSDYHQSFWGQRDPVDGTARQLLPAPPMNHSDEELEVLARLVRQRTAWQVAGRTGAKDGLGRLDPVPGMQHPALQARPQPTAR